MPSRGGLNFSWTGEQSPGYKTYPHPATALTLRELEWSCSGVHVLHDWAYFCGGWGAVPAMRLASMRKARGYLCSGFDELQFHGSFNTFFHLLLGIHQWKKAHLAVINCSVFNPVLFVFFCNLRNFFFFLLFRINMDVRPWRHVTFMARHVRTCTTPAWQVWVHREAQNSARSHALLSSVVIGVFPVSRLLALSFGEGGRSLCSLQGQTRGHSSVLIQKRRWLLFFCFFFFFFFCQVFSQSDAS